MGTKLNMMQCLTQKFTLVKYSLWMDLNKGDFPSHQTISNWPLLHLVSWFDIPHWLHLHYAHLSAGAWQGSSDFEILCLPEGPNRGATSDKMIQSRISYQQRQWKKSNLTYAKTRQDKTKQNKTNKKNTELYPCWSFTIYVPSLIPRQLTIILFPGLSYLQFSGVVKGGPGRARAHPKHHVRAACHAISRKVHEANGLAYSRCPANTNDLPTPLLQFMQTASDQKIMAGKI